MRRDGGKWGCTAWVLRRQEFCRFQDPTRIWKEDPRVLGNQSFIRLCSEAPTLGRDGLLACPSEVACIAAQPHSLHPWWTYTPDGLWASRMGGGLPWDRPL